MKPAHLLCAAVLVAAGPVPLWAAAASASTANPPPSSVRFIDSPSSEKPAAREKRLKRECKGRPNAGMCLGHTR